MILFSGQKLEAIIQEFYATVFKYVTLFIRIFWEDIISAGFLQKIVSELRLRNDFLKKTIEKTSLSILSK